MYSTFSSIGSFPHDVNSYPLFFPFILLCIQQSTHPPTYSPIFPSVHPSILLLSLEYYSHQMPLEP